MLKQMNETIDMFGSLPTIDVQRMKTMHTHCYDIAGRQHVIDSLGQFYNNPWFNTKFAPYAKAQTRSKGKYGEQFARELLSDLGHDVETNKNVQNDWVVDGIKTEVKFSLSKFDSKKGIIVPDAWVMNHVALFKDWDRLIFIGINPEEVSPSRVGWMTRTEFFEAVKNTCNKGKSLYFNRQQGGNEGKNDDYMASGKKIMRLFAHGILKDIKTW